MFRKALGKIPGKYFAGITMTAARKVAGIRPLDVG